MAGGGLGGALSGLSAMYGGYKQGEMDEYKLDDVKRQELAKVAMGNALKMLGGGQQGGMGQQGGLPPPGMPPGPPQQPMQPSPGSGPAGPGPGGMPPRPAGGMPPGGLPPQIGGPPPQMRPQMPPPGAGGPPGMPQGGPPPVTPQGMGGQQPGGRQLDWRQLVQAVQQSNPDIKPDVLAEAVNQFLPMMNAQSQQEWRMVSLQLREDALKQREQQFELAERGRTDRAELGADSRKDVAEIGAGSREKVAGQRMDQQQRQFDTREARLQESLKLREDATYQNLEMKKEAARQRAEASNGRQGLAELRAAIDEQDKHVRTRIMAASANNTMKPEERKKLLEQADKEYSDQMELLRNQFGAKRGGGAQGAGKPVSSSGPSADAVTIVQTPEEAQKLTPGTRYKTPDGQEYTR
jgi:hypothetical protein